MARLYANENFPRQVVEHLRLLGHDVLTTQDAGNSGRGIPDEEVLDFAVKSDRALITLNRRDFIKLHRISPDHRGVIVCTEDADVAGQASRIDAALREAGPLERQLLRVNRPSK